ncbi:ABC transporter permease [Microbacterium sp. zg.Y625]|uniref:ABC transporter permease n=1 Tax=Microbacterium jiangjiandongii TaxID=3049071 RepID=UPI00214C346D|nr:MULTISPECIES: ABC transporter permease [unclassified Microbacterium]MCR2792745.1 ABC transporter permease [Microbacterium sp. zg.Y625]WIM26723.1 ABC transporter permease [Microbacterium sp. zg-Y625]
MEYTVFTFLLRRIGAGLVLMFVVTAITFFLTYGANIPVALNILGPTATPGQIAALNADLGLDRPILEQYVNWVAGIFRGDLGVSYFTRQPVAEAMASRLPVTLSVVVVACIITIAVSILLGVASATRGGILDSILQGISTVAYVFPAIVLGVVLVYVFAIVLKWVPAIGFVPISESPGGWFASVILPGFVLAIGGIASLAAQIRGSMIDELNRDYVRTLRSRGISDTSILLKHALRNAAGPALTTFSLLFIAMFGSSLFIEKIFALPGFGSYGFLATTQGDLPAMLGVTLFSVALVVVVNLLVDLANGWLNPKVRL